MNDLCARAYPYPPHHPPVLPRSAEQLQASLQAVREACGQGPFWLFAYGSLIWRPECPAEEMHRARLHGYHRGLYLWSHLHRGTPERPGLVLGLDRGGSCNGVVYRLPEHDLEQHLQALWRREMAIPAYRPKWLACRLEDGRQVRALVFTLQRQHPGYAGTLPDPVLRDVLTHARGISGSTRDYVENTVRALRLHAMPDRHLEAALSRVRSTLEY